MAITTDEEKNKNTVLPAIKAGLDTVGNAAMAVPAALPDIGGHILNTVNAGVRAGNRALGAATGMQYPESALPKSNYPTRYTADTLANARAAGNRFLSLTGAKPVPPGSAPGEANASVGDIPTLPSHYVGEGPRFTGIPDSETGVAYPGAPGGAAARGSMNWNPNGGDPTIPYRVGERNMQTALPGGPALPAQTPGRLSAVPVSATNPGGFQYVPGSDAPGVVAEARRRGIGIEETGAVPGGNVSGGTAVPAGYTAEDQARDVQARRDSAVPAMTSYTQALDQRNTEQGIHGAEMARQIKAYRDKYGIDLKPKELELKQQEFAQKAPLVAAETAAHLANAGKSGAEARKADAEASATPGKAKSYRAQFLIDAGKELTKTLHDITVPDEQKEPIRQQLSHIENELSALDAQGSNASAKKEASNLPKDGEIKTLSDGRTQAKFNSARGQWEKVAPNNPAAAVGPVTSSVSPVPGPSNAGSIQLAAVTPEDINLGTGRAGQTAGLMELQKQYQDALKNDDFDKAEAIKRQMQEQAEKYQNVG